MLERVKEMVREQGIHTIRLEFPDFYGIMRGKAIPAERFWHVAEEGVQFALPVFALDLSGNVASGSGVAEEVEYADMTALPDLATFGPVPWEQGTARVLADLYFQGRPLDLAPRQILRKIVQKYRDRGLEPVIASELEFYLCKQEGQNWVRYVDRPSMVYTTSRLTDPDDFTGRLRAVLAQMGMTVLASNHEFFPSQYEINLKHLPALEAADATAVFKHVVKEMACREGLLATFLARPFNGLGGSGYHLHVSLRDAASGKNAFFDPANTDGLSPLLRSFVAGQLIHAAPSMALLAPTVNSYKRYQLFSFAPVYILWGLDNRTTYVRIPAERGEGTRVENRAADAAANPYLVMAAVLAAGLDGIERNLDPGEAYAGDAYQSGDPAVHPMLPNSLGTALDALEKDGYLGGIFGPEFVKAYLAVKRMEYRRFLDYVTDWEFNEYAFYL